MKFREMDEPMFDSWVETLPEVCRDVAKRIRPDRLYRLGETGQRVFPLSYAEDGTVTVAVDARFNFVTFERQVFGINPDDLTECDLPGPDESVGTILDMLEPLNS
jgi:hypothetical protein